MKVLVIDVGGTHVKILASGQTEERRVESGPKMSAAQMVRAVRALTEGWAFDAMSIGCPGAVRHGVPAAEPYNRGKGWGGFDFAAAFGCPVKIVDDAAMQALGSFDQDKRTLLFLGLGTGLGSTLVVEMVQRLQAALLPDDLVLGGGNVHQLKTLPPGCRAGDNANAFIGGFRLWPAAARAARPARKAKTKGAHP